MKILFYTFTLMIFAISASASNPIYNHNNQAIHYKHSTNTMIDQDRCQAEANYMAANNITGHVWGVIGNFEGVGYGNSPNCQTCTPNSNMRMTGDASALGRNGKWYRVRSWRY
jgi:hypothetical protein